MTVPLLSSYKSLIRASVGEGWAYLRSYAYFQWFLRDLGDIYTLRFAYFYFIDEGEGGGPLSLAQLREYVQGFQDSWIIARWISLLSFSKVNIRVYTLRFAYFYFID